MHRRISNVTHRIEAATRRSIGTPTHGLDDNLGEPEVESFCISVSALQQLVPFSIFHVNFFFADFVRDWVGLLNKLKIMGPKKKQNNFFPNILFKIKVNVILGRKMLTLESRCKLVVGGGVLVSRTQPNG